MTATSFPLLLFCLIYSPLAFGTVDLAPKAISQAAIFAGVLLLAVHLFRNRQKLPLIPGLLPLTFLFTYILLQTVPLPPTLLSAIGQTSFDLHAAASAGEPGWQPLTLNPRATFSQLFHFASFAAIYLLAVLHCTDKGKCRELLWVLITVGAIIGLICLLQQASGSIHLLWLRSPSFSGGIVTGPILHRNQFASYMTMLAPLALTLAFHYKPKIKRREGLRQRLLAVFNDPGSNRHFLLGFAAVLIIAAVFVSLSRGGILSLSLICLLITIAVGRQDDKKSFTPLLLIIFFCMSILVGWIGWDSILARFQARDDLTTLSSGRLEIWNQSLPLLRDIFATGSGLGTFTSLFPSYSKFQIYGHSFLYHAHNDYLEVLSDLGLIGFGLLGWFLFSIARSAFTGFRKRRDSFARYLFIAAGAGIAAQLLHLTIEYNLQSGAVGITFYTLLALLVSGGHTRFRSSNHKNSRSTTLPSYSSAKPLVALIVVSSLLLVGSLYWNVSYLLAEQASPGEITWNKDTPREELHKIHDNAARASRLMPLHSYYRYLQADTARLLGEPVQAEKHYQAAIRLNPAQPTMLQSYGFFLADQGRTEEADHFLQTAVNRDRANIRRHEKYGNWLLSIGNQQKALQIFGQAMAVDPGASKRLLGALTETGFVRDTLRQILPERVQPYLALAKLAATEDIKEAEMLYLKAMDLVPAEPKIHTSFFLEPYTFYKNQQLTDEAVGVLRRGTELVPRDINLRLTLAAMYEEQAITYRAIQEYKQILAIDPTHKKARQRLDVLK